MEFFESPPFTRYLRDYLADEEYGRLQYLVAQNPELGEHDAGHRRLSQTALGGPARRGKGRRGGLRIIYYYFPAEQQIWLMTLYGKDEGRSDCGREARAQRCYNSRIEGPRVEEDARTEKT